MTPSSFQYKKKTTFLHVNSFYITYKYHLAFKYRVANNNAFKQTSHTVSGNIHNKP